MRQILKTAILTCALMALIYQSAAQQIAHAEYYIDTDPGAGSGIAITGFSAAEVVNAAFSVPSSGLAQGFHKLGLRSRDNAGNWSLQLSAAFYLLPPLAQEAVANVTSAEYFIDTDPGVGNGTAITFSPQATLSNLAFAVNTAGISQGFHKLMVRTCNAAGQWSLQLSSAFYVMPPFTQSGSGNLVAAEYFIDSDPGVGNGTAIAVGGASADLNVAFEVPIGGLALGFHKLLVRTKDAQGRWSNQLNAAFYVQTVQESEFNQLAAAEYYIDADPGAGNATSIAITGLTDNLTLAFEVPVAGLDFGFHKLAVRTMDASGTWSNALSTPFYVLPSASLINQPLTAAEWFVDTDPGVGNGTPLVVENSFLLEANALLDLTPLNLTEANHTLFVRVRNAAGFWSLHLTRPFTICNPVSTPSFTFDVACAGLPTTFTNISTNVPEGSTYAWDFDGNGSTDATGEGPHEFTFTQSGTFAAKLTITEPACGTSFTAQVVVPGIVAPIITVQGNATGVCSGQSITLTAPSAASYLWSTGATTQSINAGPGSYFVTNTNAQGCTAQSATVVLQPFPVDDCGVCYPAGEDDPEYNTTCLDCAGVINGTASLDGCGICTGGTTGVEPCATDCAGVVDGTASIDLCGVCSGGTTGLTPNATCTDCNGEINGTAGIDLCGICAGGNTGIIPGANCLDCAGVPNGGAAIDLCGVCSGGATGLAVNASCSDCAGEVFGTASIDECGICSGGNSGVIPNASCTDCAGVVNGSAILDQCGICAGGTTGIEPCIITSPPTCAALVTPANNAVNLATTGTLNWQPVLEEITGYRVFFGTDASDLPLVSVQTSSFFIYTGLANTTYFWKVVPFNNNGDAENCPVRQFTTAPQVPACASLIFPADGAQNLPLSVNLQWENASGAPTSFRVRFGTNPAQLSEVITQATQFTVSVQPNNTYFWQIVPFNFSGNAVGCPLRSFSTINCTLPLITASNNGFLCPGSSVLLSVSQPGTVTWSNGSTGANLTTSNPGTFTATLNDGAGCVITSAPVSVALGTTPFISSNGIEAICEGETLTLEASNTAIAQWSTGESTLSISVSPEATTQYTLTATSPQGCSNVSQITIAVNPSSTPAAVSGQIPADGAEVQSLPANLSWIPGAFNTKFDVFIWLEGQPQPAQPTIQNTGLLNVSLGQGPLVFGSSYNWQVVSKNGDCASTSGPILSFTVKALPDLRVAQVVAPSTAFAGQTVGVNYTIENIGEGGTPISGQWVDAVYLSTDEEFSVDDILVTSAQNVSALTPGNSYVGNKTFTLPQNISGTYFLLLRTNSFSTILQEVSLNNNLGISNQIDIALIPPPDLQIILFSNTNSGFSGTPITATYAVQNFGNSPILNGTWVDKIYVVPTTGVNLSDLTPDAVVVNNLTLQPGESYSKVVSLNLPEFVFGLFSVILVTDANNQIFESPFENNNTGFSQVDIFLTPPADLAVTAITAPATVSSGQSVSINYTVQNQGISQAVGAWKDRIYISSEPSNPNLSNAAQLVEINREGILTQGQTYTEFRTVTVPANLSGTHYFYVYTDALNTIFEFTSEANNLRRSDQAVQVNQADLIVESVGVPQNVSSGQLASFSWAVRNQGSGGVINAARKDFIYLSPGATFNEATAILVDSLTITENIPAGAVLAKNRNAIVPNGLNGNFFVIIKTDARNQIPETNEINNNGASAQPASIQLSPSPDLVPVAFEGPAVIRTTEATPAAFTVQNSGVAGITGGSWIDRVYLSTQATFNVNNAFLVGSFPRSGNLPAGADYVRGITANLPPSFLMLCGTSLPQINCGFADSTNCFIHVVADANNQVFEFNAETNNIFTSAPVLLVDRYADHAVTAANFPLNVSSGSTYSMTYTVQNQGETLPISTYNTWRDVFLLSQDTIPSNDDLILQNTTLANPLAANATYSRNEQIQIPNGLSGAYYIFLVTNYFKYRRVVINGGANTALGPNIFENNNSILGEYSLLNNARVMRDPDGTPLPTNIQFTPPPDLKIIAINAPSQVQAGQPLTITYTVRNEGTGITIPGQWQDRFFLSISPAGIENVFLGQKSRTGALAPGEQYTESITVNVPLNLNQNFFLFGFTDSNNNVFESMFENNNTLSTVISVIQPPAVDLTAEAVQGPLSAQNGEAIQVSWDVRNIGVNLASGIITDGIYLSDDATWSPNDILLGTLSGNVFIPPFNAIGRSHTVQLANATLGEKFLIVKTNILNNLLETSLTNNEGTGANTLNIFVPELPLDVLTPETLVNSNTVNYRVEIPADLEGETLVVTLTSQPGSEVPKQLFIRYGALPTAAVFDVAFSDPFGSNQEVVIPSTTAGDYYISARNSGSVGTEQIDLLAAILPFGITNVTSNKGGNSGSVTTQIRGAKFEQGMEIRLISAALGEDILAYSSFFINSTKLFASFDLNQKPLGLYDVVLRKADGEEAVLIQGFEIEDANTGGLFISGIQNSGQTGIPSEPGCDPGSPEGINQLLQLGVISPSSIRAGLPFTMGITFGNAGNTDIPSPTRILTSSALPIALTAAGILEGEKELIIEFSEPNGPPNILRPGYTGTITIYTKATNIGLNKFKLN